MTQIKLTFVIVLKDYNQGEFNTFKGPAFHRFLPNNKLDRIKKELSFFNGHISFWFEQRGHVQDYYIVYNYDKKLVEKDLIPKQGIIDGGYLFGQIIIKDLPNNLVQVLKDNKIDDPDYISFGKKIVKEVTEQTNLLISILRELYKQYWIKNLTPWDSRYQSLGSYCKSVLNMDYTMDHGKTWKKFIPNTEKNIIEITATISEDYSDFISKKDWNDIKRLFKEGLLPSFASSSLMLAHSTCDKGDLKKAFIESVTSLEMAIEYTILKNPKITKAISLSVQSFENIPLKSQFVIIALLYDDIKTTDIENSVEAINIRNRIVHEGYNPKESEEILLYSLLSSISKIIKEQVTKFPSIRMGNCVMHSDSWDKLQIKTKK